MPWRTPPPATRPPTVVRQPRRRTLGSRVLAFRAHGAAATGSGSGSGSGRGSRPSRWARVPLTRSRPSASASAHALPPRREPQPRLGVRLDDVGWGAAGVSRALHALHRAERGHPDLDAAPGCEGAELVERVAHGRRHGRAVDPLRVRPPGREGSAAGDRVGASAGGHTRIVGGAGPPLSRTRSLPSWASPSSSTTDRSSRWCRRTAPVGGRPRRPDPARLRVRAAPGPVRRRPGSLRGHCASPTSEAPG